MDDLDEGIPQEDIDFVNRTNWQVGDVLWCKRWPEVRRRIVSVDDKGYEWEYPDVPGKTFHSVNSSDPTLVWWQKV